MDSINYVTNLDVNEQSGGWSGMNYNIFRQLSKSFDVHCIDKVDPPVSFVRKASSRLLRSVGRKGLFPTFSSDRLSIIAKEVQSKVSATAPLTFYHGSTSWIKVPNHRPYAAYLDCCFASYINVYHNAEHFSPQQLKDIFKHEAHFLKNALAVFFSSRCALDDAKNYYNLTGNNFFVAGLGGGIKSDGSAKIKKPYFLFIALDFFGKGGDTVVHAFEKLHKQFPHYTLKIAGQQPPHKFISVPQVEYVGKFDKSNPKEYQALVSLIEEAWCFVLPSGKDMTPLVIAEAASMGCPVIATKSFGIPEMVVDGRTGILVDPAKDVESQLIEAMKKMVTDTTLHRELSTNASVYAREQFSWERTGKIISDKLLEHQSEWMQ